VITCENKAREEILEEQTQVCQTQTTEQMYFKPVCITLTFIWFLVC